MNKERIIRNAGRYLGYKKTIISEEMLEYLNEGYDIVNKYKVFKHIIKPFTLSEFSIDESNDLKKIFQNEQNGILLVTTLGAEIDRQIEKFMLIKPSLGSVISAISSAMIEEETNELNKKLRMEYKAQNKRLTSRFSPGYGDAPLSMQEKLLSFAKAQRIGVYLVHNHFMKPTKSISAIIAVYPIIMN